MCSTFAHAVGFPICLRQKEIVAKARSYGLVRNGPDGRPAVDVRTATQAQMWAAMDIDHKLTAAEEVLAKMAQSEPNIGFVRKAIAVIRAWLRKHVPELRLMKLTDAEIITQFILPARAFVERVPGGGPKGKMSFSRSDDAVQNEFSEAESRIGGVEAYEKARNNGDTKLTYRQWVQVRTPSFKKLMTFDPAGIKSATGNNGSFDGSNPDIRFSRTLSAPQLTGQVRDKLNETFNHPGKLSWWHKTVGSQYNLAERNPAFKKVFDAAQDFINDVSYYATDAANLAPKILPKLETLKDLTKSAISAADSKAVAAPVFEGTLSWARDADGKPTRIEALEKSYENLTVDQKARMLMRKNVVSEAQLKAWKSSKLDVYEGAINNRFDATFLKAGVRWTDAELKSIFKLTDEQAGLYNEFRSATDASLDNMAKAQMLREAGKDVQDMRDFVMDAPDLDTAATILRDEILNLAKEFPDRSDVLADAAAGVLATAAKVADLKKQGYAPLSRFGRFTVDVVVDGLISTWRTRRA